MNAYAQVPPPYAPLFDPTVREVVEASGRVTAKTTSNEILAVSLMLKSRKNNVWYCRAEKNDIRETIFSSMLSTIQMMGLEKVFSVSLSPFRITCKKTGAICYFSGINGKTDSDVNATKGFTPALKSLILCILDEADQVKHANHITGWEATAARFMLPNGKYIFAYNPPMSRSHWANAFFGNKVRNGATRIYCTWQDITALLTDKTIEIIENYRKSDPEYYRYFYLGENVVFRGMVYPQFKRTIHLCNIYELLGRGDKVTELNIGIDEGAVFDSTCAAPLAIMASGLCVCLDCFENDPVLYPSQAATEQSRRLWEWYCDLLRHFPFLGSVQTRWIFECAEGGQLLRNQFMLDNNLGESDCLKVTNKSITGDIKRVRNMLAERILLFHVDDQVNTMQLVEDIENYMFDEKTNEVKKGQRDDTIDALEYGTKLYYNTPI